MRCVSRSTKTWNPASSSLLAVVGVSAARLSNSFFSQRSQIIFPDMVNEWTEEVEVVKILRSSHVAAPNPSMDHPLAADADADRIKVNANPVISLRHQISFTRFK